MEILPGIHVVPGSFWWRVYLIEGDTLALVDTGLPWNARGVLKYIGSIGRSAEELRLILMTPQPPGPHHRRAGTTPRSTQTIRCP